MTLMLAVHMAVELLGPIWQRSGFEVGSGAGEVLPSCTCGGMFEQGASPRCPQCKAEIGRDEVLAMLMQDAVDGYVPQTSELGDLQECVIVEGRAIVKDD